MTDKEMADILLAEYSTLRDELLQRNTVLNQTFAIGSAVVAAALSLLSSPIWAVGLILILVLPAPLTFFALMLQYDTEQAARRLREIESAVNELAGKELLVWETRNGILSISYIDRMKIVLSGRH
jgi:hypothetical protein